MRRHFHPSNRRNQTSNTATRVQHALVDSHANFTLYCGLPMTFQGTMLMLHPKDLRCRVEMVFQAALEEPNSFLKRESTWVMPKKDGMSDGWKSCDYSKLQCSIVSEDMIFWQIEATKKMNSFFICLPFWWWSAVVSSHFGTLFGFICLCCASAEAGCFSCRALDVQSKKRRYCWRTGLSNHPQIHQICCRFFDSVTVFGQCIYSLLLFWSTPMLTTFSVSEVDCDFIGSGLRKGGPPHQHLGW